VNQFDGENEGKIAELICNEPLLYKGLTTTELTSLALVAFLCWTGGSFVLLFISSASLMTSVMALPVGLILSIFTVVLMADVVHRLKRNKPDGHYEQKIKMKLKATGLSKSHLIIKDQRWGL